jgi:membrane protein YqaA with SNARE-associated domain
MFASILSVAHNLGYPALVLLVMSESSGVPLPGETALITGAVLASQHRLQIALVIALAAAAAILGDNAGYLIGRKGGRWLLLRPGPFARHRARVLEVGEPFFARHGSRAVFPGTLDSRSAHLGLVARRREPHAVALVRTHDLSASLISKVSGGQCVGPRLRVRRRSGGPRS